jgi:broad specificity phosphatase PhoE
MGLFYLLRHGETEWNAENRFCGCTDVPLSEAGRGQARSVATRLKPIPFEALYSSPLERALETARVISESVGLQPVPDFRLVELDYGQWEGKTVAGIMESEPETFRAWDANPARFAPPGGESGLAAQQRVVSCLDSLAAKHPVGPVLVVFHKTVCRLAICHVLGMSPSEYRRRLVLNNAALSIIQIQPFGWQLITFNDTSHLSGLGLGTRDWGPGIREGAPSP